MKAEEALQLAKTNEHLIPNKEYDSIIKDIEIVAKQGHTELCLGMSMPTEKVQEMLMKEGYRFYSIGNNFLFPKMYSISWKK